MGLYIGGNARKILIPILLVLMVVALLSTSSLMVTSNNNDIITSITESPNTVVQGETGQFEYEVENKKSQEEDELEIRILVDGDQVETQTLQDIAAGETVNSTFTHQFSQDKKGDSIVTVTSSQDNVSSSTSTVRVLKEDEFQISVVERPEQIFEGERAVIKYEVQNVGEVEGQRDIVFSVDGDAESTDGGVTLGPGEVSDGTFSFDTEIGDADQFNGSFSFEVNSSDDLSSGVIDVLRVPELQINDFSDQYPDLNVSDTYGQVEVPVEEVAGVGTEGLEVSHRVVRTSDGLVVFEDTVTRKQLLASEERQFRYDVGAAPNLRPGTYRATTIAKSSKSQEVSRSTNFRVQDRESQLVIDSFTDQFPNTVVNENSEYGIIEIDISEVGGNGTRNFTVELSITGNNVGNVFEKTITEDIVANGDERFFFEVGEINQVDTYNSVVTVNSENTEETQRSAVFSVEEGQPQIEVDDIGPAFNDSFVGEEYGEVQINVTETEGYEIQNIQGELIVENSDGQVVENNVSIIDSLNGDSQQLTYSLGTFENPDIYSAELIVNADGVDQQNRATAFEVQQPRSEIEVSDFEGSFNDSTPGEEYGSVEFNVSEVSGFDTQQMLIEFILSRNGGEVVQRETIDEDLEGGESNIYSVDVTSPVDTGTYNADLIVSADNANTTTASDQFEVLNPSSFGVVSAEFSTPTIDRPGINVDLTAAIENTGDIENEQNITLSRAGEDIETQNLNLSGNQVSTVEFENISTSSLNHDESEEYIIRTEDDSFSTELNVRGESASFSITNVAPRNIRVEQGQTGPDLYVTVTNQGDIENITSVSVDVINDRRETQRSIDGGQFSTATFENIVPPTAPPGDYTIDIQTEDDNETVPLTITEQTDTPDDQNNNQTDTDPGQQDQDSTDALPLIIGSLIVGIISTLAVVILVFVVRSEEPMDALPVDSVPLIGGGEDAEADVSEEGEFPDGEGEG